MNEAFEYRLSRRDMLRGLVAMPAMSVAGAGSRKGFLYAGSANLIHVVRVNGETFEYRQSVESKRPAALALHPSGRYLYAANDVKEDAGLARGTIEAYAIGRQTGRLRKIGQQALTLSATCPRSIAVAPDGSYLISAAYAGGVYNALPIDNEGGLGGASAIRKEVGSGPHPERQCSAHPHSVIFDAAGWHVISSDLGCDWVSAWRIRENRFVRVSRISFAPGAGPGALALDANGGLLSVVHELAGGLSTHSYNPVTGEIGPAIRRAPFKKSALEWKLPGGEIPLSVVFLPS